MDDFFVKAITILVPMILSLTIHEFAHAQSARWLGDRTAESMGRLTLNPIAHIDIFGTIILPLISIGTSLPFFGWAKPVPTNPTLYTRKVTMKTGYMLVSIAGPISNILFGLIFMTILKLMFVFNIQLSPQIYGIVLSFIMINIGLAFFNLLPIPPLDGSKILMWLLPNHIASKLEENARYFFILLMLFLFFGWLKYLAYPIWYSLLFFADLFQMKAEFLILISTIYGG
ncbi:site-2 protease family protein [bacterium]|nr:site-2 protease family protein [bacterium]